MARSWGEFHNPGKPACKAEVKRLSRRYRHNVKKLLKEAALIA
jgi:hypothetical protein